MTSSSQSAESHPTAQGLTPASIARYLAGAPPESAEFDFFIGKWDCMLRFAGGPGSPMASLPGTWQAKWLHERRILFDDLTLFLPDGREILGWTNLRTYSAETGYWEISGQRALEPASGALTRGREKEGAMHLEFATAEGDRTIQNHVRFFDISPQSFEWEWKQQADPARPWKTFVKLSAQRQAQSPAQ